MAEWFKAHAWKVCVLSKVPWVRIPLSPPIKMKKFVEVFFHLFFKLKKIEKPKSKAQIFINFFWDSKYKKQIIETAFKTKSQLFQEIFVLNKLNFKKKGFFVEFGACDGIYYSNTFLLEKKYKWEGILAEPNNIWKHNLLLNRSCKISHDCVSNETGKKIDFYEQEDLGLSGTIRKEKFLKTYKVRTISLNDLLHKYQAPKNFDYLSIDTEGTEYEILKSLDFSKFKPKVITCEHNFNDNRNLIKEFLFGKGYEIFAGQNTKFDDWYFDKDYF